jgi:hypothetical protein
MAHHNNMNKPEEHLSQSKYADHRNVTKGSIKSTEMSSNGSGKKSIVATYDYLNESGKLLFQSVRFDPKSFSHRRPDGNGGWKWNLKNIQ